MNQKTLNVMLALMRAAIDGRSDPELGACDERVLLHAVNVGLGPMLYRQARNSVPSSWQAALRVQDLAARVESLGRLDALEEIVAAASPGLAGSVLLLKGVSLCQRLYPEPHLRMMGDIDLLVESSRQLELEAVMHRLGYEQRSQQQAEFYDGHHHSMPFRHPRTGIVVEVHSALFRPRSQLGRVPLFQPGALFARSLPGEFRGYAVRHLDAETELAYLATHWINERRFFGTAMIPIMDIGLRLRQLPETFEWDRLLKAVAHTAAAPYVRLALTYLHFRIGIPLPAEIVQRLASLSTKPGPMADPLLHRLIDRYAMVGERYGVIWSHSQLNVLWDALMEPNSAWRNFLSVPWRMIFPPGQARRFHPGFHSQRLRSVYQRWWGGKQEN